MKCKECDGKGEIYQKFPDCINCESWDRCGAELKSECIVPSNCESCNGTGQDNKEYTIDDIQEEFDEKNPWTTVDMKGDTNSVEDFLIQKIIQLTNRVQELENER